MPDPNNIVLPDYGLVFILIPKIANSSIKYSILQSLGMKPTYPGMNHAIARAVSEARIMRQADCHEIVKYYNDYTIIGFCRNPYTRFLSLYHDKVVTANHRTFIRKYRVYKGIDLNSWAEIVKNKSDEVADQHFRSQFYEMSLNGKLLPDHIIPFETINEGWKLVQSVAGDNGLKLCDLTHHNKSKKLHKGLTDKQIAIVNQRYPDDFEAFGYEQR